MRYNFDELVDRRHSDSTKWNYYGKDVLPLWTADMDFRVPQPVIEALHGRVNHGIFGYCLESVELREVIVARLARLYGWCVQPKEILFQTGVVAGFNRVCQVSASSGDGVLVQPPVYPPMLSAPERNGLVLQENELSRMADGRYEIDFASFEAAITERTRVFILCNPHNPVGRAFQRAELEKIAEICLRKNVLICSDEIHCDILFGESRHIPVASLGPEIGKRTVTLMAPSKTFNVPGLHCSFAVVPDPDLRRKIKSGKPPHFPYVNVLGFVAALAAYSEGQEWLEQALSYLGRNRDLVSEFIGLEMPAVRTLSPEATYLFWLDCRGTKIGADPYGFFLENARVALSDGSQFGKGGRGFVRLNFACPRSRLVEALYRMKAAFKG